jgi:hypothetical protein
MRTPYRIATTIVAAAAVFPFGMGAASADTAQPAVIQSAWYWANQSVVVGPEVVNPPSQLSGVPDKDLAVSYQGDADGKADKVTYLAWDVTAIPQGSTVNAFEFTVFVEDDPTVPQVQTPDYKLVACGAVGDFIPAQGGAFGGRPADDCAAAAPGKYDAATKSWTFDVAPYANAWANGDPASGIGILPAPDTQVPFQVVLKPASTVKTSVDYTPPAPVVEPVPDVAPVAGPPVNVGVAPPPAVVPAAPQPVVQPAPSVAPPVVALPQVRPVAPVVKGLAFPKKTGFSGAMWGGALAAVALLGIASLILGDATVETETSRTRTVTRSLRERQARSALPRTRTRVRTV